jgi:hypothetical protein
MAWFENRMKYSSIQVNHIFDKDNKMHTYVVKHDICKNWSSLAFNYFTGKIIIKIFSFILIICMSTNSAASISANSNNSILVYEILYHHYSCYGISDLYIDRVRRECLITQCRSTWRYRYFDLF